MLRNLLFSFIGFFVLISLCNSAGAQQWSGLLAPHRAVDWSQAGAGSIPSRSNICQTLGVAGQSSSYAQSVTASQIVSALQACAGSNGVVYLNPGTYTMTQTLFGGGIAAPSNVTLRGANPNQTILKWTATSNNCNGINSTAFCIYNGDSGALQYSSNVLQISSGVTNGSTSIVVGGAPSGFNGSASNLHIGSLLAVNQQDDSNADNGNWWACGTFPYCTWGGSDSWGNNYPNGTNNPGRSLLQIVTVTGISGNTVTFSPGLYGPKWSMSNVPYATFSSSLPVTGFGLEDIQLNTQQMGDIQAMFEMMWVTNSWVKDVSFINNDVNGGAARKHAEISSSAHITIRDSYMYGSSPSSEGYGIDFLWGTSDSLAENNIAHHMASAYILESGMGDVFGYNFAADNFFTGGGGAPNWQQCDVYHHNAGDNYDLTEGHEGICAAQDDGHGTSFGLTYFRSYFNGHDPATSCPPGESACGTATKLQATDSMGFASYNRYSNVVANVLGTSTYHNTYQNQGAAGSPNSCPTQPPAVIYSLNFANGNQLPFSPACTGTSYTIDNDPLVSASLMRWGNYDTVGGAVRTNSGETGSSASTYPALGSPSTAWSSYPSFYLAGQPSWWGSMPWPAVGPDVTGGNVANLSGHVYHNPAANCFLNVLGGKTDGSSGPLKFNASTCYPTGASSAGGPPPPSNLTGTVQ